jgi:hypothetical protein
MYKKLLSILFTALVFQSKLSAQTLNLTTVSALPANFKEGSGLIYTSTGKLLTHNDSSGKNEIAIMDSLGNLLKTIVVDSATNVDWEDITNDINGNYYIGDFGNNLNDRTDLKIYKIPNPELALNDTVVAQTISFAFSNQSAFPPANSELNFDCEALVWKNDSIFVFTKNRTVPFNGYTNMYSMPATPGNYIAQLTDSFYCGPGPKENYWITAAAFNGARDKLVLLSSAQIWLFQNFNGTDYFGGNVSNLQLSGFTQKEGITFDNGLQLYICDEQTFGFFGNIYKTDLNTILASVEPSHNELSNINFYVDGENLVLQNLPNYFAAISLVNVLGETVFSKINCLENYSFALNEFAKGFYILKISDLHQQRSFKILID